VDGPPLFGMRESYFRLDLLVSWIWIIEHSAATSDYIESCIWEGDDKILRPSRRGIYREDEECKKKKKKKKKGQVAA
jgi:hypothetical protein